MKMPMICVDLAPFLADIEKNAPCGASISTLKYDAVRAMTALQGLVNREIPRLFLFTEPHDHFWLEYLSEEGKMLAGCERMAVSSFDQLLEIFKTQIAGMGLVIWDEAVPATANVASVIAGVESCIPVRGDDTDGSILRRILAKTGASVRFDLRGMFTGLGTIPDTNRPSTQSAKCDAYLWALDRYCNKTKEDLIFYTLDGAKWRTEEPYYPDLGNAFIFNLDYAFKMVIEDVSRYRDYITAYKIP